MSKDGDGIWDQGKREKAFGCTQKASLPFPEPQTQQYALSLDVTQLTVHQPNILVDLGLREVEIRLSWGWEENFSLISGSLTTPPSLKAPSSEHCWGRSRAYYEFLIALNPLTPKVPNCSQSL